MVKSKKAAQKLARKSAHSRPKEVKNNPFEIHTNKRKHDILGRKLKHDTGLPGISRSKAIKKRQKTLLVEYKQKNKANMFIDRRFGEYDEKMTLEDKMMKRFTMEKKHHHERHGKYRLEDEELTHLGQSLGEIDKFEDVQLSDDDDDDNVDKEDAADDVKELHFGGFLTKKSADDKQTAEKHKSKKEIMEEVVAKAKIKKHERQMAKEETVTLRDKLDKDWKKIQNLVSQMGPHSEETSTSKADDYDIAVRQLAFELKGKATDRLKSENEIAKEEQERLNKLELERQRRMKGLPLVDKKPKHISADDLGDSFTPAEDDRCLLSYQDGSMINAEDEGNDELNNTDNSDEELDESASNEGEDQEEEGDNSTGDDDDEDDDDMENNEEESSEDDNGSDLESEESNDELDNTDSKALMKKEQQENILQKNRPEADQSKKELPFTFKAPKSFEEFKELIEGWSYKEQLTIIERIKACHNPKITPENKPKMEALFSILLEYVGDLSLMGSAGLKMIDKVTRHLFDVAQYSPVHSAKCMQQIVKDIHKQFTENRDRQGGKGMFLGLPELLFLRIVSMLFSTSDFKHSVCTPAMVLLSQVLAQSPVRCMRDVFRGLFVCDLFLEYVALSKRFAPEAVNFLGGILFLASKKESPTPQLVLPFKDSSKWRDLLKLQSDSSPVTVKPLPLTTTLGESTQDELTSDEIRVDSLSHCLSTLDRFVHLYQDVPASFEVFAPVKEHLQRIPVELYPASVKELHSGLLTTINDLHDKSLTRKHLTLQARRPEAIKTFEPKFEDQ
ncbi:nucleolar protein 14-like [Orbicella faveolata]|uniref:nucleolar protein 14-like n=1 Tax=Orbicella faveolata TaxID=48498 RepID=UPI0009E1C75C|nr:nucleolar protein 14-like [Orbicella faveolata]